MYKILKIGLLFSLAYGLTNPVWAECPDDINKIEASNYLLFAEKYTEKCYTKKGVSIDLIQSRLSVVKAPTEVERYYAAADLLEELSTKLTHTERADEVVQALLEAAKDLRKAGLNQAKGETFARIGGITPGNWQYEGDLWVNVILKPLQAECNLTPGDKMNETCFSFFNQHLWTIASAIKMVDYDVISPLRLFILKDKLAQSNQRLKRWDSYFYDTQFQYPWELAFNFTRDGGFESGFLDRDAAVPNTKWVLLHPDVGLSATDSGVDGSEFNPALTLQWIGFQRWNWKGDKAHHPWGIAITSTFSDIAGLDDTGHGVSLLYDKYTLTFTEHSSELVVTLNLNLGAWLNSENKTARWIRNNAF